jgi:hypothetical protein
MTSIDWQKLPQAAEQGVEIIEDLGQGDVPERDHEALLQIAASVFAAAQRVPGSAQEFKDKALWCRLAVVAAYQVGLKAGKRAKAKRKKL